MLYPRAGGGYHKGKKFPGVGRGRRSIPNADVLSEIRNPDQMQKGRHQKAKEILRLKNKSAKAGKFPNKFQRNGRSDGDDKGRGNGRPGAGGRGKGRGNGRPGVGGQGKGRDTGKGNRKGSSKGRGGIIGKMRGKGAS
jgi:ATP-dependent RNA helicase DDX54/DBP10